MSSTFRYIADERSLGERLGRPVAHPIRLFSLDGLGLDQDRFLRELAPTFSLLGTDEYLLKLSVVRFLKRCLPRAARMLNDFLPSYYAGDATLEDVYGLIAALTDAQRHELDRLKVKGSRARSISRYLLSLEPGGGAWDVIRVPVQAFAQSAGEDDIRSFPRVFRETSRVVSDHAEFKEFLRAVARMVQEVRPRASQLEMTLHQMAIYADALGEATNSPEGTHQDGCDFIVSALVVERSGVHGGESVVILHESEEPVECLRHELQPGEGLFQADKNTPLWHDVTPIFEDPAREPAYGHRSILGLDINVLAERG